MIKIIIFAVIFSLGAAIVSRCYGWLPAIRRHPWQAFLLAVLAFGATLAGGTKGGGTNEPPPVIIPSTTNIILRLYWHAPDRRLYPIDALLQEIQ